MPSIEILLGFAAAALAMNLSPGPSNFYVMARSIGQGAGAGMIAAVLSWSPVACTVLKLAGAACLIYLGVRHFSAAQAPAANGRALQGRTRLRILRESILVEVTNPKTALFFLALLPQFVAPEAGPAAPRLLPLGLIVTLSAIPCDLAVALASGRAAGWMAQNPRARRIQERMSGTILIGLGGYILFEEARD